MQKNCGPEVRSSDSLTIEGTKKILKTSMHAFCDLARRGVSDPRTLDEIDAFEEAVKHGPAALALLRRLRAYSREHAAGIRPMAHVADAIESFFAEIPERG